ncbi:MAG: arylsulfatase [Pseudomonadota bacterium]
MFLRTVIQLTVVSVTLAGCSAVEPTGDAATPESPTAPNIVLIIADDLGWGEVGYNGSHIKTPAIDALAGEGLVFDRFYAYPTCSQTRAALLTGRRAGKLGLYEPITPWSKAGIPADTPTLAELMQSQGYATWLVGKWHLGHHTLDRFPHRRGYDYAYGNLGGEVGYYTHAMVGQLDWQRNGQIVEEEGHTTDLLTQDAIRLLRSHDSEQPYFLTLSYNAPHTPLQPKPGYSEPYAALQDERSRMIAGLVAHLDDSIGLVIQAVAERPDADNTLVLFMSDNGAPVMFGGNNGRLKGSKMSTYEGGVRVPAIAWWPGRLNPGILASPVSVFDLFPTLASLSGAAMPADDYNRPGADIWPALADGAPIQRQQPIGFEILLMGFLYYSVYDGDWKLVAGKTGLPRQFTPEQITDLSYELYNVAADPSERDNLASSEPDQLTKMRKLMDSVDFGPPKRLEPPPRDWTGPMAPTPLGDRMPITRPNVVEAAEQNERESN